MTTRMIRENDAARIDGVPAPTWGAGKETTFMGCLEAAMAVTGHPVSYADLMGLTGLATRIRWYRGDNGRVACPSAAVGEFPEETEAVARTGWTLRHYVLEDKKGDDLETARRAIVASIDGGRPVLVYPDWNVALAVGYEDGGKTFLVRDYGSKEPKRMPVDRLGAFAWILDRYEDPGDRRKILLEGLRTAARNASRDPLSFNAGKYTYGDAAFGRWIELLGQYDSLPEERRKEIDGAQWFIGDVLRDSRQAASVFLRDAAKRFPKERAALERAADLYEREARALDGPWREKQDRARLLAAIKTARLLDADASSEIRNALRAEGIAPESGQPLSAAANREILLDKVLKEYAALPDGGRFFNNRFTSHLCRTVILGKRV